MNTCLLLLSVFLPSADIVVAPDAVDSTRFAAQELADHLSRVTETSHAIVTNRTPGRVAIYVGFSPDVAAAGFSTNALAPQAFTIAFRKDAVYLFGVDEGANRDFRELPWMFHFEHHATLYAVYDFLRDWCGVEWYDPTDAGTGFSANPKLTVKGPDVLRAPFVRGRDPGPVTGVTNSELWRRNTSGWTNYLKTAYASCWAAAKDDNEAFRAVERRKKLFNLRMKGGGDYMHVNHSFYGWYERFLQKGHKNFEAYHPDWFAQGYANKKGARGEITAEWDGTHEPPQLCYSHPGVIAQVVKDAREYFDNGGITKRVRNAGWLGWQWGRDSFCLEPMDNSAFCRCPRCVVQYEPQKREEHGEFSRYWFTFVNAVAVELAKSHPDKKLTTLAYGARDALPQGLTIAPNVNVHFCFSFNRTPYSRKGFERQVRQMKEWHVAYPDRDVGLWLYPCFPQERTQLWGGFHCFPGYYAKTLAWEFRLFKELNVRANIFNCGFCDNFENFLTYRWMWDPDEPLEKLTDTFFAQYGTAAEPMRKFYDLVEETYCNPSNYPPDVVHQDEMIAWGRLGTERVMRRLAAFANAAFASPDLTPVQKARLANWRAGVWDYMRQGNVRRAEFALSNNVRLVKTAWLGRSPEPFVGNVIAKPAFDRPFAVDRCVGRLCHWRTWDGGACGRFRVTVDRSDALRATCRFRIVGVRNGEVVPFSDFLVEERRPNWRKDTPESVAYTTFDLAFQKPVGLGCTRIGIEDDSPSQGWNWPRYLSLEAAHPVFLVYNEDNSAFFFRRKYGNELTEAALRAHVNRIADGGRVTHYFMCPNAMCASFDSKTRDPVWRWLDDPTLVSYDWMRGVRRIHELGIDPYAIWTEECRRRGISPWLTMRMNDIHNAESPDNAQHSSFWRQHPEFRRGYPDGLKECAANALDYAHPEVRAYNLAFISELLERYDVDGLELDWLRFPFFLKDGRELADAPLLTEFVRAAKRLVGAAAKRRGHAVCLGVRVPTRIEKALATGLDVRAWTKEELVDWIVPCNQWGSPDFALPVAAWKQLAGPKVKIVPGLDFNIMFEGQSRRPLAYCEYAAYATRVYERGADGVYLFNLFDQPTTNGVRKAILDLGLEPTDVRRLSEGVSVPAGFN